MSFSFFVRAATSDEAKRQVVLKLDEVVASQPIHELDRRLAEITAGALADFLTIEDGQEISVSVSGSLGWRGQMEDRSFSSANLNVSASVVSKE
jgi:hypothetical protein